MLLYVLENTIKVFAVFNNPLTDDEETIKRETNTLSHSRRWFWTTQTYMALGL